MAVHFRRAGTAALALLLVLVGEASRVSARVPGDGRHEHAGWREGHRLESSEGGSENIRGRILDYLERHGDRGRIDPEWQLRRVAAEYGRHQSETAARRLSPASRAASPEWISLGPTNGAGRMTAIAPVPGSPGTAYAGAAGGGVWKTSDGGGTWVPLTDGLHDLAVGALAVPPTNPSVLYVGTGEGGYGSSFIPGIGLIRSFDGGATWVLPESVVATAFYRILVHPSRADELVAGTNGGAFRSTDGGVNWVNVIARAAYGDVPDLVRDPKDPQVLYASTWCADRACEFTSAHVLRSSDGGVTWSDRSAGLPSNGAGRAERTSLAISPSDPNVLYAARGVRDFATTGILFSRIYKTTNAGSSWSELTSLHANPATAQYMGSQSFYDNTLVVSPNDPNIVIAGGGSAIRSVDGGGSFAPAFPAGTVHPDFHDLQYAGSTLWMATDGGVWTSEDDGKTATPHNSGLVTRQFYSLANDPFRPEGIIGGTQDNGSEQRQGSGTEWRFIGGGDGIQCAVHPLASGIAWTSIQGGWIGRTFGLDSDSVPRFTSVTPPYEEDESLPFNTVVRLDPREPSTLYTATSRLWRSRDGGDTWRPLSTATNDGSEWDEVATIRAVGLPTGDSPVVIVAKGGGVFRSGDGGEIWSAGRGLPAALVTHVEIDPRNPSVAFACLSTTEGPPLYRSADGGLTWTPSAGGLPAFPAQVFRFSPTDENEVFCGTDVGVFRSTDRGASWERMGGGLPASSVHDLQILPDGSLLRAATYGRGIWELRNAETGNRPPFAAITSPGGPISVNVGSTIEFSGTFSDPDAGDGAAATWFFPDDSSTVAPATSGAVVRHTFRTGGIFPVTLSAADGRGARSSSTVSVSVREASDSCGAPAVIPGAGPFPYTLSWNDEAGATEASDPPSTCQGSNGRSGSTWLEFTPAAAGTYDFSTCTEVNTSLSIFTGAACGPYTRVPFACNPIGATDSGCGAGTTFASISAPAGQTLRVMLGGVMAANVGEVRLTVALSGAAPRAPRVDRVGAAHGSPPGGTAVVINGAGFAAGAAVSFGGAPATEVAVLTSRVIVARAPPHAPGLVDVSVSLPGRGAALLGGGFRYDAIDSADRFPPVRTRRPPPPRAVSPR